MNFVRSSSQSRDGFLGRKHQRPGRLILVQWQFEPTRAKGIPGGNLSTALLDGVWNAIAPFRLRMIDANVAEDAQLPVRRGREGEPNLVRERVAICGEMIIRRVITMGFGVKIPVLDVNAHREMDMKLRRQIGGLGGPAAAPK